MKKRRAPPTVTATTTDPQINTGPLEEGTPGIVLIWMPRELPADDRAPIAPKVVIGRSSKSDWCIPDRLLSREHLSVERLEQGRYAVKDLESKNGTYLDGVPIETPREASANSVIQAGSCVFTLCDDLASLAAPGERSAGPIAGRFYAVPLVRRLRIGAKTGRHLVLAGESGSGKELAAREIHSVLAEMGRTGPFVPVNAACFGGEEHAVASLVGVVEGTFTGVSAQSGAIADAEGGTLFLDEVHNLPPRAQRSLLRFAEDGLLAPLGSKRRPRRVDVRLVLGTNLPLERACDEGLLASDLMARLHRLTIPPLGERRADIPSIFRRVLTLRGGEELAAEVAELLDVAVFERLCLHDYVGLNVRALEDLVGLLRAAVDEGVPPKTALAEALDETLGPSRRTRPVEPDPAERQVSLYERHREEILRTYRELGDNISRLEASLRGRGIKVNRRWLVTYLDRWGVRPARKKR